MTLALAKHPFVRLVLVLCVCALSLLGCDRASVVIYYNNTGHDAVIQMGAPEIGAISKLPNRQDAWFGLVYETADVTLYFDQEMWIYQDLGGERSFRQKNLGLRYPAKYQIEPDGAIYLLPSQANMPVETFPEQPKNFPRFPTRKKTKKE